MIIAAEASFFTSFGYTNIITDSSDKYKSLINQTLKKLFIKFDGKLTKS